MMGRDLPLLALVLALPTAGCGSAEAPRVDSATPPSPVSAEVRPGACPFECCTYGTWTPQQPVVLYAVEGDTTSTADTIPAGEGFTARTGNVHLDGIPTVVLTDTLSGYDTFGSGAVITLQAGDTAQVLDYVGEGAWNVRSGGRILQVTRFWHTPDHPADRGFPDIAEARTEPVSSWWVEVTRADGRTGWLLVRKEYRFGGGDRCGGP